jgi:hypothetical protein
MRQRAAPSATLQHCKIHSLREWQCIDIALSACHNAYLGIMIPVTSVAFLNCGWLSKLNWGWLSKHVAVLDLLDKMDVTWMA